MYRVSLADAANRNYIKIVHFFLCKDAALPTTQEQEPRNIVTSRLLSLQISRSIEPLRSSAIAKTLQRDHWCIK